MIWRMSFFWRDKNALRQAQAFARVGVIRADLHAREFAEGNFLGAVVKQDAVQRVAGILRADQMREGERDAFGGSEAVLAVKNHAVAAIEHQHRGAGALILALMDHQVGIIELDGHGRAVALDGIEKRSADVHVQRVAKFVLLRSAAGFDAGGEIARVVPAEAALSERGEQILERFESEKIERLVGDFKSRFGVRLMFADLAAGRLRGRRRHARLILLRDVAFFFHALDDLVDQVAQLCVLREVGILEHLLHHFGRNEFAFLQRAQDRLAQIVHVLLARTLHIDFVDSVLSIQSRSEEKSRRGGSSVPADRCRLRRRVRILST